MSDEEAATVNGPAPRVEETVKINLTIRIHTEGEVDTGVTVSEWNHWTDDERQDVYKQIWADAASNADSGGARVVTDGAKEI